MKRFLVGDIGGTNCRFAIWEQGQLQDIRSWPTAQTPSLADCLTMYGVQRSVDGCCVAVAGPVTNNAAHLTNVGWSGHAGELPQPAWLINDLQAAACGVDHVSDADRVVLNHAAAVGTTKAVMGIGTGLGQALVVGEHVLPTEGGHADFAPADPLQDQLLTWLRPQLGRVTLESVLSGPGLGRILAFFVEQHPLQDEAASALQSQPAGAVIQRFAQTEPACAAALDLFLKCAGSAAGNLGLRTRPDGGVFLCGGILPRFADPCADGRLRDAYTNKAPMQDLVGEIPLTLITHPHLGLLGAGAHAQRCLLA